MKLTGKLSQKQFVVAQILILVAGLAFIFGLYYILNLQYPQQNKPFEKGPVTSTPKTLRLELKQPDEDVLSFEPSIVVSGKSGPSLQVLIYSDTQNTVIQSAPDGSFSTVFNLAEGVNIITVAVFDTTGEEKSDTRSVYYSREKI